MKLLKILGMSFLLFGMVKLVSTIAIDSCYKACKVSDNEVKKKKILSSFLFLIMFITIFIGIISGAYPNFEVSNLEGYLIFILSGVVCIFWCYFKWDSSSKWIPRVNADEKL